MPSTLSLLSRLCDVPVAVVDVETTGSSPRFGDRVTEVGVARYEPDGSRRDLSRLIDPHRRIPGSIVTLTGISQDMVDGQPTFEERLDEVVDFMADAIVVGHNVRFDLGFLSAEFRRGGTSLTAELGNPHVLDTVKIARRRFGRGGNGLQKLSRRLGVMPTDAHRALADAVTTGETLKKLLEPQGGFGCSLLNAIQSQGGPMPIDSSVDEVGPDLPPELIEALESRQMVRMTYLDARRKETCREIEPLEIRRFRGTGTLIAYCRMRDDRRTFKLDRIVRIERITA